jgi:hypothetical protein
MHLLIELIMLLDILYYLNWNNSAVFNRFSSNTINSAWKIILYYVLSAVGVAIFLFFITIYALDTPSSSGGHPHSYSFTNVIIGFVILHYLIIKKAFAGRSASIFKLFIIAIQIGLFYLGLYLISLTDTYEMNGIFVYVLQGRFFITAFSCVWMTLSIFWMC